MLDYSKVEDVLVNHLINYVKNNNLKSVVLGISGGIDSTVVAVIAYKAKQKLGKGFKFYGATIPSETTKKEEYESSLGIGRCFCDEFKMFNPSKFEKIASGLYNFSDFTGNEDKLRKGNIKSRLRTVMLYDMAKATGGIVLGTDNWTEYLLGFSTIGGDALFDYCPIQGLWKTEVYGLAKHFTSTLDETRASKVLNSIALKPQDGLGISESDMDQIGANNYEEVDYILQTVSRPEDCEISEEVWEKVMGRCRRSYFKRDHPVTIDRDLFE